MPTSSGAQGVNTTQMSAGDPKSQTKLAVICTNTPLCLPHIASLKTQTHSRDTSGVVALLGSAKADLIWDLMFKESHVCICYLR